MDLCDTLVVEVQPPLRQLCLVLLDAGIVAELQSTDMQNFRAVFTAVVQGQVRLLSWGWGRETAGESDGQSDIFLFPLTILPKRGEEPC